MKITSFAQEKNAECRCVFRYALIIHVGRYHASRYAQRISTTFISLLVQAHTRCVSSTSIPSSSSLLIYPSLGCPLTNAGSHADAIVPIGGYLCPSCSICGPHVHHCSEGTLDITPATCLPQPHQVDLSGQCQRSCSRRR